MSTGCRPFIPEPCVIPPERLQLALLAGRDLDLRRLIQHAGERAPEVRRQIRHMAHVRPVRVRGLPGGRVHLMAVPVLLDFQSWGVVSPAEVRLFTPESGVASRMHAWWRSAVGSNVHDLRVLPHAVHVEAVLGISPTAVHELAFFGASLVEGARVRLPQLRLPDRSMRETGNGPGVPYLLMALATGVGEPVVDKATWRHGQLAAETLLGAVFATSKVRPIVSLLPPAGFFDAVDAAQVMQLASVAEWLERNGGSHRLELHHGDRGQILVECIYELPKLGRTGRMIWAYDGTWREPPDLAVSTGRVGLPRAARVKLLANAHRGLVGDGQLH